MASETFSIPAKETSTPQRTPLSNLTNLELLYLEMADRFPSIEDLDSGAQHSEAPAGGSFLDRERAVLGDDADLFSSGEQQRATVEDGDNDLLGGDFSEIQQPSADADELDGFESSFPAIDTRNDVCCTPSSLHTLSNTIPRTSAPAAPSPTRNPATPATSRQAPKPTQPPSPPGAPNAPPT